MLGYRRGMDVLTRLRSARSTRGPWWFAAALVAALANGAVASTGERTGGAVLLTLFLFWRIWNGGRIALGLVKILAALGAVIGTLVVFGAPSNLTLPVVVSWLACLATVFCLTAPAVDRLGRQEPSAA